MIQIPFPTTQYNLFTFSVDLTGSTYLFTMQWNARAGLWFYDMATDLQVPVLSGQPLLVNKPLFHMPLVKNAPPYSLQCIDTTGANQDPGYSDLASGRHVLLYAEGGA